MTTRRIYQKVDPSEIQADAPLDTLTLQKMRNNDEYANSTNFGMGFSLKDLDNKQQLVERLAYTYVGVGSAGELTHDVAVASSSGVGILKVTGDEVMLQEGELYPMSPLLGMGGFAIVKCDAAATVSFGVECYDESETYLGNYKEFIMDSVAIGTSWAIYQGVIRDEGAGQDNFPAGTKFVLPTIQITGNTGEVHIDSYGVFPLNYAKAALFM